MTNTLKDQQFKMLLEHFFNNYKNEKQQFLGSRMSVIHIKSKPLTYNTQIFQDIKKSY